MVDILTNTNIHLTPVEFDPFGDFEIEKIAPSTESQKEIWASCIIGGEDASRGFNESISLQLKGVLDRNALEKAFKTLIIRNESLRSVFSTDGKQICIFKDKQVDVFYQDLSSNTSSDKQELLSSYIKQDALFLFSLVDGPLIKIGLFKLGESEHQLVLTTHHIICDGWSIGILLQDLGRLYSCYTQNIIPNLPESPQFSDYAYEHQKFVNSESYRQIEEFWLEKFQGEIPVLKLPTDFDRPPLRTYKSNRIDYSIDTGLISELKKTGIKNGCSLVITLMAAFEVFLHRLTSQDDIVLGLHAADQSASGNYRLIGHCVNLLPLKSKPKANIKFSEFLKQRKTLMFDAYENQHITFGSLLKKLKISRDASRVPLIPVIFNIDMGLTDHVDFYGLEFNLINNPREYESFEIFLNVTGSENSFTLEWAYNTQLFKPESIDRMMTGFEAVLRTIVANPDVEIKDILIAEKQEQIETISRRNDTDTDYQKEKLLIQLINEIAINNPAKVALVYSNKTLFYKELNQKANQLARFIIEKNISVGDVVGLALDRSPEMIIALLAILKTGATFLPIDPELPEERISFMLTDSSARMLVTSKKYENRFTSKTTEILVEDALCQSRNLLNADPEVIITGKDIAYIIYTSGSTGQPKGVLIEQFSILNYIQSSVLAYSSDDPKNSGSFVHLALSFDASLTALFVPLITGKVIVISSESSLEVFNDENLIKFAPFDFIKLTPSQLSLLHNSKNDKAKFATKKLVIGGEALLPRHINFLIENNVDVEIINEYGPTEATVGCTSYKFNVLDGIPYSNAGISIGKPMPNVKIYILDKFMNPVPDGVEGEIFIGGVQVGKGYLNRPELDKEKFIINPFNDNGSERLYRTGDLGQFTQNGNINYSGRIDQQLKVRGYRIEPGEIEHLITKQKNVKQALIISREDRIGDQRLVAYIVTDSKLSDDEFLNEVKDWKKVIKDKLPVYMCPADFVNLSEIPLTVNGKVDRESLPKPDLRADRVAGSNTRPNTAMEKLVADVWKKVLDIESINIHDDFFEVGGHSLLAIEVVIHLAKQIGKQLPMSTLLEHSTIYKLASTLDSGINMYKWKSLVPVKPEGNRAPLYIVHGAGLGVLIFNSFASHMHPDQPVYGLQGLGMDGNDEPFSTVEETAAFYISEILQQNPKGPYMLAGFSNGGIIAFEMARQLRSMGKQVDMLAMFDTNVEESLRYISTQKKLKRILVRLVPRLFHETKCLIKHPKKAIQYQKQCLKLRFIRMAERLGFEESAPENHLVHIYHAMDKYDLFLKNYVMKPYAGTIDLFRCKIRVYYVEDFVWLGWKPFISKEILIHQIPGDHEDMLLPANSKAFAQVLQDAINNRMRLVN